MSGELSSGVRRPFSSRRYRNRAHVGGNLLPGFRGACLQFSNDNLGKVARFPSTKVCPNVFPAVANCQGQPKRYCLPDELFKFTDTRGNGYSVDLLDAHEKLNEICKAQQTKIAEDPDAQFHYLDLFRAWLKSQGIPKEGAGELRRGELNRLFHQLRIEFIVQTKKKHAEYESIATSPISTASTPAA